MAGLLELLHAASAASVMPATPTMKVAGTRMELSLMMSLRKNARKVHPSGARTSSVSQARPC
jgi:hypothetical protein